MKRFFFALVLIVLNQMLLFSQDRKVIAVIANPKNIPAGTSLSPVMDQFVDALKQSTQNRYRVVDRSEDFMNFVDFELDYQASGLVDDDQMARIGKRLGADMICGLVIEKSIADQDYYFRARIIDVENTEILGNAFYPNEIYDERKVESLERIELQRVALYLTKNLDFMTTSEREKWEKIIDDFEARQKTNIDTKNRERRHKKTSTNTKALGASLIPGLGLILKGHNAEGVSYMLGDIALVGGGVGMLAYANSQRDIMEGRTTDYDAYQKAQSRKQSAETASYVCFGAAGVVYIINLIRSYVAEPKPGAKLQWTFTTIQEPSMLGSGLNVGLSIAYRF